MKFSFLSPNRLLVNLKISSKELTFVISQAMETELIFQKIILSALISLKHALIIDLFLELAIVPLIAKLYVCDTLLVNLL